MNKQSSDRIALVDMDGTIADYERAMERDYDKLISPGDLTFQEASTTYGKDDWPDHLWSRRDVIQRQPGWWRNLERLAVGFEIIEVLRHFDFELNIATKGPSSKSNAWAEKLEWVREHLPHTNVHITEDKSLLYGKILVDDWPSYASAWLRHRPRGLVIMPAHHYNEHFANRDQVFRYESGMQCQLARCIEILLGV